MILLPLLTLLLTALEDVLALDGQVLVYLLAVVVIAMVGGVIVAVGSAVAAALLINYFFVEPVHTFTVGDPDQARRARRLRRRRGAGQRSRGAGRPPRPGRRAGASRRPRRCRRSAGAELDGGESLREVLRSACETFNMESVTLLARAAGSGEWVEAEHFGWAPPGEEAPLRFDVPVGPHLRMVGRGPGPVR